MGRAPADSRATETVRATAAGVVVLRLIAAASRAFARARTPGCLERASAPASAAPRPSRGAPGAAMEFETFKQHELIDGFNFRKCAPRAPPRAASHALAPR